MFYQKLIAAIFATCMAITSAQAATLDNVEAGELLYSEEVFSGALIGVVTLYTSPSDPSRVAYTILAYSDSVSATRNSPFVSVGIVKDDARIKVSSPSSGFRYDPTPPSSVLADEELAFAQADRAQGDLFLKDDSGAFSLFGTALDYIIDQDSNTLRFLFDLQINTFSDDRLALAVLTLPSITEEGGLNGADDQIVSPFRANVEIFGASERSVAAVPLPAGFLLILSGFAGFAVVRLKPSAVSALQKA